MNAKIRQFVLFSTVEFDTTDIKRAVTVFFFAGRKVHVFFPI